MSEDIVDMESILSEDSDSDPDAAVIPISIRTPRRVLISNNFARRMLARRAIFIEERMFEEDTQMAIRISMSEYKPQTTKATKEQIEKICPEMTARLQKDKCTVCLEHLKRGDKMRQLPCFHYLHSECLVGWFTQGNTICPVCRYKVNFD